MSIVADASDVSVGGALQQEFKGTWHPIALFSRKLDKMQQHYSAFDCELFAAYTTIRHFRHFVDGRSFHKLLVHAFYCHDEAIIPR